MSGMKGPHKGARKKARIFESEALDRFYKSATTQDIADEENGLYGQLVLFIFGQFLVETRPARPR